MTPLIHNDNIDDVNVIYRRERLDKINAIRKLSDYLTTTDINHRQRSNTKKLQKMSSGENSSDDCRITRDRYIIDRNGTIINV